MLMQAAGTDGAYFTSLLVFLEDLAAPVFPSGYPERLENGWVLAAVLCLRGICQCKAWAGHEETCPWSKALQVLSWFSSARK